jgi:outer membrane lipoprotein LolB
MRPGIVRGPIACAVILLLTACAGHGVRPLHVDAHLLARQDARERVLAAHPSWSLQGRLGVSDARDSGSGSLEWTQHGREFRFSVHAPVTGKTWVLSGDSGHATLEGLHERPVEGRDAADLLERELRWRVPVAELSDWARGARAPGAARIAFRADGLPGEIDQAGWKVQYLDYDLARDPPLPSKVFASKGDRKVRLAIRAWTLP